MNSNYITIFFILSFTLQSTAGPDVIAEQHQNRRILHQPLFPSASTPPPSQSQPPPPPDSPAQDQPFFHELPNGPRIRVTSRRQRRLVPPHQLQIQLPLGGPIQPRK
ncbi:UNVERIFIED_CONTAM: hypothetical protein Sangu_1237700 [Sesamum angustifolium]|uniref:Uncharacterized protein n=1 Tax=Sesamum angustifolium TaxID=2727405 RepID=A0AAW2NJW2_9LAMI